MKIADLKFNDQGLIPVIVQDVETKDVLMMAWANEEALRVTFERKLGTFWSRSRQELWTKGETSGDRLHMIEVRYDCDEDVVLYLVRLEGEGACHTGEYSCFYRTLDG